MKALVMGSFDPITLGHISVVEYAIKHFDQVIVCVMVNEEKTPLFTVEEREEMLKRCFSGKRKVIVASYRGMCYDYCIENGVDVIVRGFRDDKDYAYELEMAEFNKAHAGVNTLLMPAEGKYESVSSSEVRRLIKEKREGLEDYLPSKAIDFIREIYG